MQFRLLWSFLFISENPLTLGNILYKTLFWKQFNSSKFVSMKAIIIGRAICHTHSLSCDIMVKMLTDGQWICYCFRWTKFSFGKRRLAKQVLKASGVQWTTLQLLHHLFGCILLWVSMVAEVWVFQKGEKRTKDCRNGCMCTSSPMVTWGVQGNPFSLKVAASFIAKLDLGI